VTRGTIVEEFGLNRFARDARYRDLKLAGHRHLIRSTTQRQDQVRLANGKMVEGEMVYLLSYPK
jgi:hypothetical protein